MATLNKPTMRLELQSLRREMAPSERAQEVLRYIDAMVPLGPKAVKEAVITWMAQETLLDSAQYSVCVAFIQHVWQVQDIDALIAQAKVIDQQERAADAKLMLPKVDPVAAKIAALEAQLAALKSGATVVKAATARVASTGSSHDLSRKMYSLGYSVKQKALKAGSTEADAERLAVEAKVKFASENGLEYTPSTPLAAQEQAAVVAPIVEATPEQEAPAIEAEGEQVVEEDQPTELVEEVQALFASPDAEVQALLQDLLPQEVAAPEKKRSHKAHAQ